MLRDAGQMNQRGKSRPAKQRAKPDEYTANMTGEVISWDITYLRSDIKGKFFYLYLFIDVYSRKVIGWEVHHRESSNSASDLLRQISLREGFSLRPSVVLHADNGGPMKGATMAATMDKLGITPSFSRPSVSNDNAFSESIFKTLKYRPTYPNQPFKSIDTAREWISDFVRWYNLEHRHGGIKYVTPEQRHTGEDVKLLEARHKCYLAARKRHPERWTGDARNCAHLTEVVFNRDIKKEVDMAA